LNTTNVVFVKVETRAKSKKKPPKVSPTIAAVI